MIRLMFHLFGRMIFLPIGVGVGLILVSQLSTGMTYDSYTATGLLYYRQETQRLANLAVPKPVIQPIIRGDWMHPSRVPVVPTPVAAIVNRTPVPAPAPTPTPAPSVVWPLVGPITTYFGEDEHAGLDIAGDGTVVAALPGRVTLAGWFDDYGIAVIIEGGGTQAIYGHLEQLFVSVGDNVEVGQEIGNAGCTGNCTGPHLHFEVRQNGGLIDPLTILP